MVCDAAEKKMGVNLCQNSKESFWMSYVPYTIIYYAMEACAFQHSSVAVAWNPVTKFQTFCFGLEKVFQRRR